MLQGKKEITPDENIMNISALSIAFILIGALFGAAFASGQEIMKFFCAYGSAGRFGFALCFILYMVLGYMAYDLCKIRNSNKLEEIATPTDHPLPKKIIGIVMKFCFLIIVIALISAGDALFTQQLGFPKGVGGVIITVLITVTTIVGFDAIKKVMPIVIPVMLVTILGISIAAICLKDAPASSNPEVFMSPLAPNWFMGAVLYLAYNFIAATPVISTLPKSRQSYKNIILGMLMGFGGICIFGFILYSAVMMDIDVAGTYDLPMVYIAKSVSPLVGVLYSIMMVIAVYSATSNCLYGLTKEIDKTNKRRRNLIIIALSAFSYCVSLVGFSQLVTYVYPIQGYASIAIVICIVITYAKFKLAPKN